MTKKMKPEIKKLWVEALRSGEYMQAREALKTEGEETAYCCLGVITDLYCKAMGETWESALTYVDDCGETQTHVDEEAPPKVVNWAGLPSANPILGQHLASLLNDGNSSGTSPAHDFNQIADLIEANL